MVRKIFVVVAVVAVILILTFNNYVSFFLIFITLFGTFLFASVESMKKESEKEREKK